MTMRDRPTFNTKKLLPAGKKVERISNPENEGFEIYGCTAVELEELAQAMAQQTTAPIVITLYGEVRDALTDDVYHLKGHAATPGGLAYMSQVWSLVYNPVHFTASARRNNTFEKARILAELIPGAVDAWQKKNASMHNPLFEEKKRPQT